MSYSKDYLVIKIVLVAVFVFSALPSFSDEYPLEFPINQNILTRYAIVAIDETRIGMSTATGLEKDAESPPYILGSRGYASEIYDTSNPTIMAINYKNHSGKLFKVVVIGFPKFESDDVYAYITMIVNSDELMERIISRAFSIKLSKSELWMYISEVLYWHDDP